MNATDRSTSSPRGSLRIDSLAFGGGGVPVVRPSVDLRLPATLEGMSALPDGTFVAGVTEMMPQVGRRYAAGDVLFVIETDGPGNMGLWIDLRAEFDCEVEYVRVSAGQIVPAGHLLAALKPAEPLSWPPNFNKNEDSASA